jgi:hypothetical protein
MSNFKHGMRRTKLFGVWTAMLARCRNPNVVAYKNYGGRGIDVSDSWSEFKVFFADMGEPNAGETLDRIDNNKGYSKENCRWASRLSQGRNKRNNRIIEVGGVAKTMSEWSEVNGVKLATIWARINKGWDAGLAVTLPPQKVGRKPSSSNAFGAQHDVKFEAAA